MMNRSGLSGLLNGARPQPSQGLAHFARGETIVPRQMMDMDPSLRRHAMQSMAMQGRDPQRYQVGGGSGVNPMTGRREFADMIYTDKGWVSPDTGQAMDFSGTGATQPYNDTMIGSNNFGVKGSDPAYIAALRQTLDEPSNDISVPYSSSAYGGPTDKLGQMPQLDARVNALTDQFFPTSDPGFTPGLPPSIAPPVPSLDGWQNPATYDAWRANRNPQGKGVAEQYYGQAVDQGTQMGLGALAQTTGQMPAYSSAGWGTPGVALGDAIDNSADKVSILNSGYNQGSMLDAYGALAGAGWGNANGGISGAGGPNGMSGQRSNQPPRNYAASFQY